MLNTTELGNSPCRSDGPLFEKLEWLDFLTRGDHLDSQSLQNALNPFSDYLAGSSIRNVLGCQTACATAESDSKGVRLLPLGFL